MRPEKSLTTSTSSNQQNSSLIILDTPQQTPTTINPPLQFNSATHKNHLPDTIDEQYIDGNGNGNDNGNNGNDQIDKNNSNNNHHSSSSTSNGKKLCAFYAFKMN